MECGLDFRIKLNSKLHLNLATIKALGHFGTSHDEDDEQADGAAHSQVCCARFLIEYIYIVVKGIQCTMDGINMVGSWLPTRTKREYDAKL